MTAAIGSLSLHFTSKAWRQSYIRIFGSQRPEHYDDRSVVFGFLAAMCWVERILRLIQRTATWKLIFRSESTRMEHVADVIPEGNVEDMILASGGYANRLCATARSLPPGLVRATSGRINALHINLTACTLVVDGPVPFLSVVITTISRCETRSCWRGYEESDAHVSQGPFDSCSAI